MTLWQYKRNIEKVFNDFVTRQKNAEKGSNDFETVPKKYWGGIKWLFDTMTNT